MERDELIRLHETLAEYHEGIADRARVPATERHHSELALRLRMEADRLKREAA
jgi:hypothetical protein